MKDLPYKVEIVGDYNDFDAIINWCNQQWPQGQGLTWCARQTEKFKIFLSARVIPGSSSGLTKFGWIYLLSFQREEDFLLYQITWT